MESLIYVPSYELFLVLEQVQTRYDQWVRSLAPLDSDEAPAALAADIYYRRHTDLGLVAVRFDERALTYEKLAYVLELGRGVGIHILDPSRLTEEDRRDFYNSYLSEYDIRVEDLPDCHAALHELGARLGLVRARPSTHTEAPKRMPTAQMPALPEHRRLGSEPPVAQAKRARTVRFAATVPRGKGKRNATTAWPDKTRPDTPRAIGDSGPHQPIQTVGAPPAAEPAAPTIAVRYLRNGQWVPARLGALSTRSAYVVTSGLPHKGELVNLALGIEEIGAMVAGHVSHVTTVDDAVDTGLSGFAVRFSDDPGDKAHLVHLLQKARAAGVRIKPPPARREVRFPVRWPVRIGTPEGGFHADALDVSTHGLFVATRNYLEQDLVFQLPMDNGDPPISGRAEIKREITGAVAKARGLSAGYGLRILELSGYDNDRFAEFLNRIKQRSSRRVLVCADSTRAPKLTEGLARAGYAVRAGNDAATLIRIADTEPRVPDVVVIDHSLAARGLNNDWVHQVFSDGRVRCVVTGNESEDATRQRVDRALHLAA